MNFLLQSAPEVAEEALNTALHGFISNALHVAIKIVIALVIMTVGFKLVNWLGRKIQRKCQGEKYDKTVVKTLVYAGKIMAKILIVICLVGYLGIDTSGLTALITSLGVCVGLAVNGALSNLAGGVLLLFTRPFSVDDMIEVEQGGIVGIVEDIRIVSTKLRTGDNKVVYIPNGTLANSSIINYSEKDTRRVDFSFSIAYESDFEKAKALVADICTAHKLVLADPAPMVRVSEHADSAITLTARVWVKTEDYWTVYWDILEASKKVFDESGIEIPYNKLDVNIKNQ
jgi:small conductance mechanosensitive channel